MPTRTVKEARLYARNEIGDIMKAAGIPYLHYDRPPISVDIAALAINDGKLRFWPGAAIVTISEPDPVHHQVVLTVDELKRTITRKYKVNVNLYSGSNSSRNLTNLRSESETTTSAMDTNMKLAAREEFPIVLPKRTFTSIEFSDIEWLNGSGYNSSQEYVHTLKRIDSFTVTATVDAPGTKQSFLVGLDEHSPFIAALPKNVKTVAGAHNCLRPPGVNQNSPRQGEWFFQKATKAEVAAIEKRLDAFDGHLNDNGWQRNQTPRYRGMDFRPLEQNSSHHAFTVTIDRNQYAIGPVLDRRSNHHSPLVLKDWHRVVRNLEVVISSDSTIGRTSRTYD